MDDDQTPWLRLALCPQTPSSLLRELLCSPPESTHPISQWLAHWLSDACQSSPLVPARTNSSAPTVFTRASQFDLSPPQLRLALPDEYTVEPAWHKLRKAALSPQVSKAVDKARTWQAARADHHLLTPAHPAWPQQMHTLPDPPALLYVIGNPALLAMGQIAMVGARHCTVDGKQTAFDMAKTLAEQGWLITSGLALGIDTQAHRGCLTGGSPTVAVMATDATHIYPKANRSLAAEILEHQGCLITETPLGKPLARYCFPRRNRLISALSLGVVVIEAAIKSGSLSTANHAANQGREVMAVPGSVRNPKVTGCHELIRQGAGIVTSAADVMQNLPPCQNSLTLGTTRKKSEDTAQSATADAQVATNHGTDSNRVTTLLSAMGYDAAPLERLVTHTGWSVAEVVTLLMQLELQGQVTRDLAGRYSRC